MYKSIYKQTFTHTCVEFDSMHFGAGCLVRMWPYYPKLRQIFSVDFRGTSFYFRYIGVSSYCSHRDHCVHADQQSDQSSDTICEWDLATQIKRSHCARQKAKRSHCARY